MTKEKIIATLKDVIRELELEDPGKNEEELRKQIKALEKENGDLRYKLYETEKELSCRKKELDVWRAKSHTQ